MWILYLFYCFLLKTAYLSDQQHVVCVTANLRCYLFDFQAHGCYVLDILHKASASGFPVVKQNLTRYNSEYYMGVCQNCQNLAMRTYKLWAFFKYIFFALF